MADTIILQDNLAFLFLCEDIILNKRKLFGTNIRQEGYFTAPLGAYLSFWKTGLPYSVDTNGNPLTSVSKEGCRAYNFQTNRIEPASLDFPIEVIIEKFHEYRKEFKRSHNAPTLLDVVVMLQHQLEVGMEPKSMYTWEIFRDKCRNAALETRVAILETDNQRLRLEAASNDAEAIKQLAAYIDTIKEYEVSYNSRFDYHINLIREYKDEIRRIRFKRLHNPTAEFDQSLLKPLKDAIRYHRFYLSNLFSLYFRVLPVKLRSISVETVNDICKTNLKIYIRRDERKF